MTANRVSVVIPAHNAEKYLGEAIESILRQIYVPFQIIVVDDGSTDETERVARSFPQIEYSKQAQQGAGAARNHGVELARGEFLAFLDADDLWSSDKLALQMAAFAENSADKTMIFGYVRQFFSGDFSEEERAKISLTDEITPAILLGAMLMRRTDFLKIGFFETSWEIGEFIDWYCKALEHGLQSQVLSEVVLHRRVHRTNQGLTKRDFQRDYVRILKASLDRRRQKPQK